MCLVLNAFTLTCLDEALLWLLTTSLYSVSSVVIDPSLHRHLLKYVLKFRNTTVHANVTALSRLLLPETIPEAGIPPELVLLCGSSQFLSCYS